jgi:hypothetical protein
MRTTGTSSMLKTGVVMAMLAISSLGAGAFAADTDAALTASTYEKQAVELRAKADKHDKMAQMHKGGAGSQKTNHESIVRHCENIAKNLRAAADESDALAAELKAGSK